MPCPAKELGVIGPFVAVENSKANGGSASCGGWRAVACGAFGHGMPCPYCGKCVMRKERCGDGCLSSAIVLRRFVGTGVIFTTAYRRGLCY